MNLSLDQIYALLGCGNKCHTADTATITSILTDSRSLLNPRGTLFFALHTDTNDGHRFIPALYRAGVRAFVVRELPGAARTEMPDAVFFAVDDVMEALHKVGAACREAYTPPVIGITGSRGKTTVKEWIYQVLCDRLRLQRSPRSFNSQIGVPLSLAELDNATEMAIIEAGISRQGEMEELQKMIRPTIGILTNIGSEHDENFGYDFGGRMAKLDEKLNLFDGNCSPIIHRAGNRAVDDAISSRFPGREFRWTTEPDTEADIRIRFTPDEQTPGSTRVEFTLTSTGDSGHSTVRFADEGWLEDVGHVVTTVILAGTLPETALTTEEAFRLLETNLPRLTAVNTRTDILQGSNDTTIITDRFGIDLDSLEGALDFMNRRVTPRRSSTIILGQPQPSLWNRLNSRQLANLLSRRNITRTVVVSDDIRLYRELADAGTAVSRFATENDLVNAIDSGEIRFADELVLVKGNTLGEMPNVVERLEARRHETVLEVNLDAVVNNFNFYKSRLRPTTGIVGMVKAFGYGAGSYELAKTLQSQGAAYLAVAVLDEGVELRREGITMPIMVLNPRVVNYDELFANRLEPEVFSFDELEAIASEARRHGISGYPVHIKFDTGMHRLGFIGEDLPRLVDELKAHPEIEARSMFSHLAAADDPSMDDYTLEQFGKFDSWCDYVQERFPDRHILRHILNSTGITRFPEHQHDMVRLGICLYGVATMDDGSQNGIKPVSALYTNIISIKDWPAGTTIGYNRRGVCHRPSRIATIPIGYADGIDRHLGNGGMSVWINGSLCPTIGNICMDACMVDVTDCEAGCRVGDRVEIFGPHNPVEKMSGPLQTIPYEILTSVSMRVKRVYYHE